VELHGKAGTTPEQGEYCRAMIRKPSSDAARYERVWQDHVYVLRDVCEMTG
jgi:hypothetical protein